MASFHKAVKNLKLQMAKCDGVRAQFINPWRGRKGVIEEREGEGERERVCVWRSSPANSILFTYTYIQSLFLFHLLLLFSPFPYKNTTTRRPTSPSATHNFKMAAEQRAAP
jgi:hypothetical protein